METQHIDKVSDSAHAVNSCHVIRYYVDDEPEKTVTKKMTPREILFEAGINAEQYYLVELHGQSQHSYEEHPDKPITVHEGARFISVYRCATPVS